MAATIKIDADTRDARRQIGHIDDELLGLVGSMRTTGRAAQGLNATRFTALATGISAAGTAFQMVGAATDFARNAIQQYFESSAEGKRIWEQIDMTFKSVIGTIGELILGTTDVGEAGRLVSSVIEDVNAIMRGFFDIVSPLVDVLRFGLVGALDLTAAAFGRQADEARESALAMGEVDRAQRELDSAQQSALERAADRVRINQREEAAYHALAEVLFQNRHALTELARVETISTQVSGNSLRTIIAQRQGVGDLTSAQNQMLDGIMDLIAETGSLEGRFTAIGYALNQGSRDAVNVRISFEDLQEAFAGIMTEFQEGGEQIPLLSLVMELAAEAGLLLGDSQEDVAAAARAAAEEERQAAERARELAEAQREAARAARELAEANRRGFAESLRQGLDRVRQYGREYIEIQEAQAEAERQAERERLAEATRMAEIRSAQKAKQMEAERQAMEMRKGYIDSAMRGIQGLIQAEGSVLSRARKVMGAELVARGQSALMQAGIAFAQLNIPKGAALTAAGSASIALGKRFGARGGGMGAGRGRGGGRSATVTQNITFAGGAGQDQRSIARSIERASRDGVLQGLGAT